MFTPIQMGQIFAHDTAPQSLNFGRVVPPTLSPQAKKYIDDTVKSVNMKPVMKTLHLVTAVLAAIGQFHQTKSPFSAHDVTRKIRDQVINGDLDIADAQDRDTFAGKWLPVVSHESVKTILAELFSEKLIPDYIGKPFTNTQTNTSYMLYSVPNASNTQTAPAVPVPTPAIASIAKITIGLKPMDSEAWGKAQIYVRNRLAEGVSPTLKSIQSRLKGYKVTCKELGQFFGDLNEFALNKAQKLSQSTVI